MASVRAQSGADALDALGTVAQRLAERASASGGAAGIQGAGAPALMEVAARYGVRFLSFEREGRMQVCYDGEAFRGVLAIGGEPAQRAQAALALSRPQCVDPALRAHERAALDVWRAAVLDQVETSALAPYLRNRLLLRHTEIWADIAWQRARSIPADMAGARQAALRAQQEFAAVTRSELAEDDQPAWNDGAMRANTVRWLAAMSADQTQAGMVAVGRDLTLKAEAGQPGETCLSLVSARDPAAAPLARRCTWGAVWPQSVNASRDGRAIALAVQPRAGWSELWILRREASGWTIGVLPPAAAAPGIGYAEFAGWVPGGRQVLVARESRSEGRYRRSFELVDVGSLTTLRQTGDAQDLGALRRWQDERWKRESLAMR